MKIMVVGGGGREHALIQALKKNPEVTEIFALPGNGGIAQDAVCVDIAATDLPAIVAFAEKEHIEYAVVAPDDPLVLGLVDALEEKGIPCFGPRKNAAIIEGSKAFAKNLMKKYGIPTAEYEIFDDMEAALSYIDRRPAPMVVKADGLALGKGVLICRHPGRGPAGGALHDGAGSLRRPPAAGWWWRNSWRARKSPCFPSPTEKPWRPWSPPWTTSGRWTEIRA